MKAPGYAAGSELAHFEKFCREHLVQSTDRWDGEPLKLYPEQRRLFNEALAYDSDGSPIWQSVVAVIARKNGKTTACAALAVYRLLTSEGSPEILLAAASDRQAGRLFDAAASFVRRSPELSKLCRVRDYVGEIVREDGRGRILRMSSDPGRLFGFSPSLVIADELAQWTTPSLERAYGALTSGGGARRSPQTFTITTAGSALTRHSSILGRIVDAAEGASDRHRKRGLLVARMPEARALAWLYEAPTNDPHDSAALKLANPAPWISEDYLARQAANPELSGAEVLQLHGCVWAEPEDAWLPGDAWAECAAEREVEDGERVVLGFDGSYNRDATALVGATVEDGHLFVLGVWLRPDGAAEWKVPRAEVEARIASAMERFDVVEIAPDPPGWHREIEEWAESWGEVVVEFATNQPARMAPACDRFRSAVLEGALSHDDDPVLAEHVGNCIVQERASGVIVTKPDRTRKIDAAVAAIVAHDRASWHRDHKPESPVPLVQVVAR